MKKLTTRLTAMLLAGMLVIGSVPGAVFAADADPGQTSEYAKEVFTEEETAEESSEAADAGTEAADAGAEVAEEEAAGASEGNVADTSEEAAIQYYTVTLDANGGYFENEWDDAVGEIVEQAEVVTKQVPVGETVAAFPVFVDPDGRAMIFAGWSMEPDGELISQAEEEYVPVDNSVLYAVWQAEDEAADSENASEEYSGVLSEESSQGTTKEYAQDLEDEFKDAASEAYTETMSQEHIEDAAGSTVEESLEKNDNVDDDTDSDDMMEDNQETELSSGKMLLNEDTDLSDSTREVSDTLEDDITEDMGSRNEESTSDTGDVLADTSDSISSTNKKNNISGQAGSEKQPDSILEEAAPEETVSFQALQGFSVNVQGFIAPIDDPDSSAVEISSAADLSKIINDPYGSYVLTKDIDLSGNGEWNPLGTTLADAFHGKLDGQGHKITGLTVSKAFDSGTITAPTYVAGLFGVLDGAQIKNIEFENADISIINTSGYTYNSAIDADHSIFAGIIAGYAKNNTSIYNCFTTGSVLAKAYGEGYSATYAGGLLGCADTTSISYSYNGSGVQSYNGNAVQAYDAYAGGLSGCIKTEGVVERSYNMGSVIAQTLDYGKAYGGGLLGKALNAALTITDCFNEGTVQGLTGNQFSDTAYAGGLSADFSGSINRAYNSGSVIAQAKDPYGIENTTAYSGGICGISGSSSEISNCASLQPTVSASASGKKYQYRISYQGKKSNNITINSMTSGSTNDADLVKELSAMKESAEYITALNWDFDKVWEMSSGKDFPQLKKVDAESDEEDPEVISGTCGPNLTWTLNGEGTLTISGTGEMDNYDNSNNKMPWSSDLIKDVIIENGVTSIGDAAFYKCENMKSVTIPDSITSIGVSAFPHCYALENLTIPDSVTSIGNYSFYSCTGLQSLRISNSVTNIGSYVFANLTNLTSVTIPDSVLNIESNAFFRCSNLNSITISNSVTSIGNGAFDYCNSLSDIYFYGNAPTIASDAFSNVTATAYYPANDPTWTEDVRQNYGGNITWVEWDPGVDDGSIINATFPKNGEIGVDPSLLTDFNIYVEFKYSISVTGNGCLYLKNQLTNEIVQSIPLTNDNYGNGYIISGNKLFLSISEKVYAGEKYYVEIDQNSLKFGVIDESTGEWKDIDTIFSGLGRNDWNFTIINFAYPNFQNHEFNIDRVLYSYLFAPLYDEFIRRIDDGSKGLCYGMSYASQAWNHKWKGVLAATGGNSIEKIPEDAVYSGLSFLQYIELVHLSQYIPSEPIECSLNANKYQKIYEAVCSSINGTGEMVMLGVDGTPGNHAILPVAILSDTDEKAEIIVYDSNCPPANKKDGERVLYLHTYLPILTFTKENNVVTGFKYGSYSKITYNTFDESADNSAYFLEKPFTDAVLMVVSAYELTANTVSNLVPIKPRNGSNNTDNDIYLYWTEDSSITTSESGEVSVTDGYKEIGAKTDRNAEITIDFDQQVVNLASSGEDNTDFTITYKTADNYAVSSSTEISGVAEGNVSAQLTEDGILLTSDNENGLESITASVDVNSSTVNTVDCTSSSDTILITIGDDQSVSIKEDTDKDGDFETNIGYSESSISSQGTCGDNISWTLDKEGILTVYGFGDMGVFSTEDPAPWANYKDSIQKIVVSDDITSIGNCAFSGCGNAISVDIPSSIKNINDYAFSSCSSLTKVYFAGDQDNWSVITIGTGNTDLTGATLICKLGKVDISDVNVTGIADMTYTGEAITQTPVVTVDDKILVQDTDYTISYANNTNIGTATVTITGKGNYTGTVSKTFTISAASIANATVSGISNKTYTGSAQTQNPTVKVGDQTLTKDTDYTVSYANNTKVGTATVKITGKGNYTGTVSKTFKINGISVSNATVSGISNKTYTGSALTQNPTVKVGDKTLTKGTDYTLSYANNINVGTATVTITGKGNYASKKTVTFKINKAAQSITAKAKASRVAVGKTTTVSITGNKGKKSYKSSNTAIATVTSAGKVTAKKVGTVKITATSAATANYKAASKTVTIKVVPAATASLAAANQVKGIKLTWKKVTGANGYKVYRGSTLIKTITSGNTVTFADTKANTNGTKFTYKVVAKATTGDSTLSKSRVIYRVSRPAVSSVTNSASKKMTVKWGKNAKANGYQIQYSTDKNFKSGNKAVNITSASTVSKVIGSLTKGKTYYVRIRTYKTVGSTKYWSIWSAARSVKISK